MARNQDQDYPVFISQFVVGGSSAVISKIALWPFRFARIRMIKSARMVKNKRLFSMVKGKYKGRLSKNIGQEVLDELEPVVKVAR